MLHLLAYTRQRDAWTAVRESRAAHVSSQTMHKIVLGRNGRQHLLPTSHSLLFCVSDSDIRRGCMTIVYISRLFDGASRSLPCSPLSKLNPVAEFDESFYSRNARFFSESGDSSAWLMLEESKLRFDRISFGIIRALPLCQAPAASLDTCSSYLSLQKGDTATPFLEKKK